MAMSVVYATVNGRLVQENRGGAVTRYIADTLGSVIQTRDASGNQSSSTTYWPFGEVRTQTGTNPSPWGFCGIWGYFKDAASRFYVRLRTLRADLSRWVTVDPLWPGEPAYHYALNLPVQFNDPFGLQVMPAPPWNPKPPPVIAPVPPTGPVTCTPAWNDFVFQYCSWCANQPIKGLCQSLCDAYAGDYYRACHKPPRRPKPGEHWGPRPAPGKGIIAPSPPPPPPPAHCFAPAPDCGPDINDCLKLQAPPNVGGVIGFPNTPACRACCNKIPGKPECGNKWDRCQDSCTAGHWLWYQLWLNQFGGPSGRGLF